MHMKDIMKYDPKEVQKNVDTYSEGLKKALIHLGLPVEGVLVEVDEREKVFRNLEDVVEFLTQDQRDEAMYISKFVAACGAGLFDAALNFLWDETIVNLRKKVAIFDLQYFFDSIITDPDRRADYRSEEDLKKLDDWVLIRGCRSTGILSDIGFQHLDYIRNMRNWASAAHPNQHELSGLQVIGWLETCVRYVLAKEPEGQVLVVQRLLYNLRTQRLSASDISSIKPNIEVLPSDLVLSLLRSVFGMFTDPDLPAEIKQNIRLIAPAVWEAVMDETKYEIGFKYSVYSANADIARKNLAYEFLEMVGGLSFLRPEELAIKLNENLDNLLAAHFGFDNFYTEPPHAKLLVQYVPESGVIPAAVLQKYVKTLILCRIGNGYGVSRAAKDYYDSLIDRFQDQQIFVFVKMVFDGDVSSRIQFSVCAEGFRRIADELESRTSNINLRTLLVLIVAKTDYELSDIQNDRAFKSVLEATRIT